MHFVSIFEEKLNILKYFGLPLIWAKGTDDVHPPDSERPWRHDVVECLGFEMGQGIVLLAFDAFLHILYIVALDGWPEISVPECLCSRGPYARMTSTNSIVDLLEDVSCLFLGDTLLQWFGVPCSVEIWTN